MQKSKLVRDKIIGILKKEGQNPDFYVAEEDEYKEKLHEKLLEEVNEYLQSREKEELADILEVVYAIATQRQLTREDLEELRETKRINRGGFDDKLILKK